MTTKSENQRPAWFVGAAFGGFDDQTERFIKDGIWEGGPVEKYGDQINSIRPGDRIAIKAWYTRKNGLPFDNRGEYVSVMAIKATGTVAENLGDRRTLRVDWTPNDPPREWYFFTFGKTLWRVSPDSYWQKALIGFTFDGEDQDIDMFLNHPYWGGKYNPPDGPKKNGKPPATYGIDNIIADGCFLERATLESMLERLQSRRNLILQGPPGTGKTWLAKKLAYALVGAKDDDKVRQVQFHPNLSYEDFVRGWRPQGDGTLGLVDGPFLDLCEVAREDSTGTYVMVIEEINRGNPASIFGELLTLLEADKRTRENALTLAHQRTAVERFHIPRNLYIIGTMNVADRSLALVDLALRRRFAFFDLEPALNETWLDWVRRECEMPESFLIDISERIGSLNEQIAADPNLGRQFRVGHSFVVPKRGEPVAVPEEWFTQVVETEIVPLLHEYWFDNPDQVEEAKSRLLTGL